MFPEGIRNPCGKRKSYQGLIGFPDSFCTDSAEVIHCSSENHVLELQIRNIAVQIIPAAFRMSHLAEDSSIRRRDALNCHDRMIRVEADILRRIAIEIYILFGNLTILDHLLQHCFFCCEAAFAMTDCDGGNFSDLRISVLEATLVLTSMD